MILKCRLIASGALVSLLALAHAQFPQLDHSYNVPDFFDGYLALTRDGSKAAIAGSDGVKIYETATGKLLETRSGCGWETVSVAWAPDGETLAAGGLTATNRRVGEIIVWPAGKTTPLRWTTGVTTVDSLAFSPDGSTLASASGTDGNEPQDEYLESTAYLWDAHTGKAKFLLTKYQALQTEVAFSPDGTKLALASYDESASGSAEIYNTRTGRVIGEAAFSTNLIFDSRGVLAPDKNLHARMMWQGNLIRAVDLDKGDNGYDVNCEIVAPGQKPRLLARVSRNGRVRMAGNTVVSSTTRSDRDWTVMDIDVWRLEPDSNGKPALRKVLTIGKNAWGPAAVATARNGELWAVNSFNKTHLIENGRVTTVKAPGGDRYGTELSLSRDGKILFNGELWKLPEGKLIPTEEIDSTMGGAISPDGRTLLAHFDGFVHLAPRKVVELLEPTKQNTGSAPLYHASWSADSTRVAGVIEEPSGGPGRWLMYGIDGKFKRQNGSAMWTAVAVSRGGTRVYSAGTAHKTGIPLLQSFDAATGKVVRSFVLPSAPPKSQKLAQLGHLELSPDEKQLAVAGIFYRNGRFAARVLVFDIASGAELHEISLDTPQALTISVGSPLFTWQDNDHILHLFGTALRLHNLKNGQVERDVTLAPTATGAQLVDNMATPFAAG